MRLRHIASIGLLFASLLGSSGLWAEDCPYTDYFLDSQTEVDALGATGCDKIKGKLRIRSWTTYITNVDGLVNLTSVGDLIILGNTSLTNVDGLINLTSVEGYLSIARNADLTDLEGLSGLSSVGNSLDISSNDSLANLNGLENLTSVGGDLVIARNADLTNLVGLGSLTGVGGDLVIGHNDKLPNCLKYWLYRGHIQSMYCTRIGSAE